MSTADRRFEAVLEELEHNVELLNTGELPLEEALKAFEKGIRLVQESRSLLDAAEQRLMELTQAPAPEAQDHTTHDESIPEGNIAQSPVQQLPIDDIPF